MIIAYKQTKTHANSDFMTNKGEKSNVCDETPHTRASVTVVTRHLLCGSEKQLNVPKDFFDSK